MWSGTQRILATSINWLLNGNYKMSGSFHFQKLLQSYMKCFIRFITVLPCISMHFTYSFTYFPAPSLILSVLTWSNESVNCHDPPFDPKTDLVQGSLLWSIHQSGPCLHDCLWDQYALFRTSLPSTCLSLPACVWEQEERFMSDFDINMLWLYWPKAFLGVHNDRYNSKDCVFQWAPVHVSAVLNLITENEC